MLSLRSRAKRGLILLITPYLSTHKRASLDIFRPSGASVSQQNRALDSFSSPVFWRILPHFGPVALPPPCISWPAVRAPFLFPSGPLRAPETRFGRGRAHWVGCIRWSYCLEWEEERPLLDGRGRWTERTRV